METGLFATAHPVQGVNSLISCGLSWGATEALLVTPSCLLREPFWCDVFSLALKRLTKPFWHPVWAKGKMDPGARTQDVPGPACFLGSSLVL